VFGQGGPEGAPRRPAALDHGRAPGGEPHSLQRTVSGEPSHDERATTRVTRTYPSSRCISGHPARG
jgi:hypothetical protein